MHVVVKVHIHFQLLSDSEACDCFNYELQSSMDNARRYAML